MAITTVNLSIPVGEGVGASSNVSTLGPERTFIIDGTIANGEIVSVEGTCDPAGLVGWTPLVSSNASDGGRRTIFHVGAFYRVRRTFAQASNSPTASVAGSAGSSNTFVSMNVPSNPGVTSFGTSTNVSALGTAFSLSIEGQLAPGEQVVLQGSETGTQWNGIDYYTSPQVGARYYSAAIGFARIGRTNARNSTLQVFVGVAIIGGGSTPALDPNLIVLTDGAGALQTKIGEFSWIDGIQEGFTQPTVGIGIAQSELTTAFGAGLVIRARTNSATGSMQPNIILLSNVTQSGFDTSQILFASGAGAITPLSVLASGRIATIRTNNRAAGSGTLLQILTGFPNANHTQVVAATFMNYGIGTGRLFVLPGAAAEVDPSRIGTTVGNTNPYIALGGGIIDPNDETLNVPKPPVFQPPPNQGNYVNFRFNDTTSPPRVEIAYNNLGWFPLAASSSFDVQYFNTPGATIYTKPAGAKSADSFATGCGAGGGSGRRGAAGTNRFGGAGGGGGGAAWAHFADISVLGATEPVTIGSPGTGGAAVTADTTNGNAGTNGGDCSTGSGVAPNGTFISGHGGTAGPGGTTAAPAGGAGGTADSRNTDNEADGGAGGAGTTTGGTAGADGSASADAQVGAAGGGGGGSGITNGNVSGTNGGDGGAAGNNRTTRVVGGIGAHGATVATAGGSATASTTQGGGGGGGGSGDGTGAGQRAGANGGANGGGGGGGAGSLNGTNSGAGGNGGQGSVLWLTY